jgi:DNA-directed RNA polymerase subunit H
MHLLQSKHIKLNPDEAAKLLAELNITSAQLPSIKNKDPAIAELGAKKGDVIKIIRKYPVEEEYFRVVV